MRHVAGDLDVGHAGRAQAVLAHGLVHQGAQLPAQLRRDPVGTVE
jgi:hypothetical protein